ncbi:MAG TPA: HEAT repeat domain-containing protein, partial [Chitinophagales bacterium]|nr:HEAT repeat domain-containing protein [Chitinophagales bacterium]
NYYYDIPRDVFDAIRYEKGGAVIHMLRNYVGDAAFFASLNKYLTTYKFGNAEVSDLRKCFEAVTGEDLSWFFNQWWYSKGHPILNIQHRYDEQNKTIELTVIQTQKNDFGPIFRIPVKVDIYTNGKKETKSIDITNSTNKFYFAATTAPQLVNFDADKTLLCEKTEDLSDAENIFKFYNAPLYLDKSEAIKALAIHQKENPTAQEVLLKALQEKNWYLRKEAVEAIQPDKFQDKTLLSLALQNTIQTDESSIVRQKAIQKLVSLEKGKSINSLKRVLDADSSILCLGAALENMNYYNKPAAYEYAKRLSATEAPELMQAIAAVFKDTTIDNLDFFKKAIWLNTNRSFYYNFKSFGEYLKKSDDTILENGIRFLADIYKYEESDYNIQGAKQVVQNLEFYFAEKAKKPQAEDKKWKIIKSASGALRN